MNILCPSCHSSIPVSDTDPRVRCESCGLTTDLSNIGTYPGGAVPPAMRDLTGETVGGYRISQLIGVGGMGIVYRATRSEDGIEVAFKVLHDSLEHRRDEFVARFEREARALARLEHPGIVRILDSGRQGDLYYIVTEYVDGADLARRLSQERLSVSEVADIVRQICDALGYAHRSGVVHRDIKPANIMVAGGRVKVLDFGLAQMTGGESHLSSLTRTDLAMGTFNYLSPEQRTNAKQVDARSDVFSLGVVFYELLTGTLPLGNFQPPSRARPEAGARCDRIAARSLSAAPADRYQTVEEMAADLARIGGGSRRGRIAILAGAAGLLGAAVAVVAALTIGATDEAPAGPEVELQTSGGKADRGQIPPFVDIGQVQQAIETVPQRQAANEPAINAEAANEPVVNAEAADEPEQQDAIKEPPPPVKKRPVSKPVKKKKAAKEIGSKTGKGSDDSLSDELLANPATKVKKPAPKIPPPLDKGADNPYQSEQQKLPPQSKQTKGKTK